MAQSCKAFTDIDTKQLINVCIAYFLTYSLLFYYKDKFRRYDFGKKKNIEIYGQEEPPEYNISMITAPVATYWSDNDWLGDPVVSLALPTSGPEILINRNRIFQLLINISF